MSNKYRDTDLIAIEDVRDDQWPGRCGCCDKLLANLAEALKHRDELPVTSIDYEYRNHVWVLETEEAFQERLQHEAISDAFQPFMETKHATCFTCDSKARIASAEEAQRHEGMGHLVGYYTGFKVTAAA